MEEARCCAILLDEAIEELLTEVVKKEVKLQDQRIRRDQKKKVDVERLPDAPGESCAGCLEIEERYLRLEAVSHREEKVWQRERELLEGEARLKDERLLRGPRPLSEGINKCVAAACVGEGIFRVLR